MLDAWQSQPGFGVMGAFENEGSLLIPHSCSRVSDYLLALHDLVSQQLFLSLFLTISVRLG